MTLKPGARCARDLKPTETRTTPRGTIMFDHETSSIELAQNLKHDGFDGAWTADDWAETCAVSIDLSAYGSDEE